MGEPPGFAEWLKDTAEGILWLTQRNLTRWQRSVRALEASMRPEPDPWLYELPPVPLPVSWQEELEAIIDVALNLSGTVRRPPRQITADGDRLKAEAIALVERVLRERQP